MHWDELIASLADKRLIMQRGLLIAEGKTKQIYAHPSDADLAIIVSKDDITAGDGVRRNVIAGKNADKWAHHRQ
jgi:ABC-type glutathione transport system ATPase component